MINDSIYDLRDALAAINDELRLLVDAVPYNPDVLTASRRINTQLFHASELLGTLSEAVSTPRITVYSSLSDLVSAMRERKEQPFAPQQ